MPQLAPFNSLPYPRLVTEGQGNLVSFSLNTANLQAFMLFLQSTTFLVVMLFLPSLWENFPNVMKKQVFGKKREPQFAYAGSVNFL